MAKRSSLTVLLAAAATTAGLVLMPGAAQAADARDHEDPPTSRELLDKCDNGTNKCMFHPDSPPEFFKGDGHQVGDSAFNCTPDNQTSSVTWSDTTTETTSLGISLSVEAGYADVFKTTLQTSYEQSWSSSHTESETTNLTVRPGDVGTINRAPEMQRVKGTYELHFEDRFHGHYYWYVPFEATGPVPEGTSSKTQHTRAMTDQEREEHCG
ncbi:hypothetical protein MTQ01_13745 [Streptomyces sp. XM4193]|uniref:hypothetical protein n=1 Tax=Streptomyces sp. XM4193 TaxID=2929782 RepID=UPI001FF9B4AD|nr:hypothetical protein [Streptomyces sp. XM4193]MCK1797061.1 hypothetical protein [Streptomyces sp. XM4193]